MSPLQIVTLVVVGAVVFSSLLVFLLDLWKTRKALDSAQPDEPKPRLSVRRDQSRDRVGQPRDRRDQPQDRRRVSRSQSPIKDRKKDRLKVIK